MDRKLPSARAPMPLLLVVSAAPLVGIIGAALAHRSFFFAAYIAIVAAIPVCPGKQWRALGVALATVGISMSVVFAARVPLGARVTAVYLPACVALLARIFVLRTGAVERWSLGSSAKSSD